jgi:glutaminyl-tRNA synthetase
LKTVYAEPELAKSRLGEHFQFLRMGYFCLDPDATSDKLIFNRTVTLRDTWLKGAGK